jgi:hypothetical protein
VHASSSAIRAAYLEADLFRGPEEQVMVWTFKMAEPTDTWVDLMAIFSI